MKRPNLLELKKKYIPLRAAGKITNKELAYYLHMTVQHSSVLVSRYKKEGESCFINGHTGLHYNPNRAKQEIRDKIVQLYKEEGCIATFANFARDIKDFYHINCSARVVVSALKEAGIKSPKARKTQPTKASHRPRPERKHKGSLVQVDGTPYDFFMDGTKVTAVGAIDDASHSLLGIHFSIAESRMSYFELFHQMAEKHVLPESFYTDWSRNFISVARNNAKMSVEERIEYAKEHKTEYMKICEKLGIKTIFALSPEAKGRVERMWQTLQLNLPMMFKRRGISTIEKANGFSQDICEWWNKYFSIEPLEEEERYITPPSDIDLEDLFSVHKEVTTRHDGIFSYCEHDFKIDGLSWGGEKINLSISYRNGFRVFWHNSWRRAKLLDGLQRTYGDTLSNTEYELLAKTLDADMHTNCVCV